ncbi:phospho-N-acetylmuramoyl-pentapeptide-transferase [Hathewaya massiliensis]|uniref:phospho-N-acetylmuramoyl-pentapeptide- transferase n=1 Tax=Hathewaya massiliensis TaxID=1964382 RepID=UPI001158B34F|nr:phospho-N-acetylmuramoyl-pentapeptide-transferase [Hathewaya massiliensis]
MSKIIYYVILAFFISLIQGPILIPLLRRLKFGQNIRDEGPKSHQKKSGTPTMGGIIFILATAITLLIFERSYNYEAIVCLLAFIAFGFIGFLDDMLKIIHKHNEGLKPYQKMGLIILVAGLLGVYGAKYIGTDIYMPFINKTYELGGLYIPFMVVFFAATTNAVNLTDGLDGLATSVSLLIITFFGLVSFAFNHYALTSFCAIVAGSLLGFLRNNSYPAKIFMGDTGSLALGGVIAAVAMMLKLPILVVIVAGIPVAETLSVIIQVTSYKLTKKRVFKMAPLHHHFELSGWHETKVVVIFSIITVILCLIGFLSLSL